MKQNPAAPPSKQQPQQQQPQQKDPPKTTGKAPEPQKQAPPQPPPKTVEHSPPKKETVKAPSNDMDHIQKMKQTLMDFQNKYFETLKGQQDPISQKLSMRNAERVEDKILNAIRKGVLQLENSKYNYVEGHLMDKKVLIVEKEKDQLQSKLQNVDTELKTLKNQKINNAYSAYSQPTLKLFIQEENLTKQQQAQETVQKIQIEAKTRREKTNKILSEKEKKEKEEDERRRQEDTLKQQQLKDQLHAKLRENIEELKQKTKHRLEKMDKVEDEYFKSLNEKLNKLAKERALISSVEIPKVQLKPYKPEGDKKDKKKKKVRPRSASSPNKSQVHHPPKKIEIEQPLYLRALEKFNKKIQKQQEIVNQERKKKMDMHEYYNQEYEEHMKDYLQKLKAKKKEYEQKRMKFLEKLGLEHGKFSQNVNASFDSKLWVLQESMANRSLGDISVIPKETQIHEGKLKNDKRIDYDKKIKDTIKVQKDKEKEEELLVLKDKTLHPERYIRMVKKKDKEQDKEPEIDVYYREEEARQQKEKEEKEKIKEKFKKLKERAQKELEQSIILSKKDKDDEKKTKEELEYEESLARQKGKEYFKNFRENHQKALELEREEREKQLQEQQKKKRFELPQINQTPKIVKNQTLGTLERHDYLQDVLKQAKIEREEQREKEKRLKEEKIKEEERRKEEERKRREEGIEQQTPRKKNLEDMDEEEREEYKRKKRALHNQKVDQIKKKFIEEKTNGEPAPQEPSIKRKADQVSRMEKHTKSMESVAEAQWTTKPLKAVEKASEVDALYVKSIQKRLELLNSAKA